MCGCIFLQVEDRLEEFLKHFDIVLIDDQTMDVVNGILDLVLWTLHLPCMLPLLIFLKSVIAYCQTFVLKLCKTRRSSWGAYILTDRRMDTCCNNSFLSQYQIYQSLCELLSLGVNTSTYMPYSLNSHCRMYHAPYFLLSNEKEINPWMFHTFFTFEVLMAVAVKVLSCGM